MNIKRIVVGTIVGAIVLQVAGYPIFILIFGDFYAANAGTATGVARETDLQWAIAVGNLALAALLTLAIESRPGTPSITQGFVTGAVVGFLVWFGTDFIHYGLSNVATLTITLVDPILELVHNGIAGAVIAPVLAKMAPEAHETSPAS